MEVHSRQRTATMLQAMAHNASTIDRDMDLLLATIEHRHGAATLLGSVRRDQGLIHRAYAGLLDLYGEAVAREVADPDGHVHEHDHGNERSLIETAHHDAQLARRYETR